MTDDVQNLYNKSNRPKGIIHILLFHSYSIYLLAIILGIIFDIRYPLSLFNSPTYQSMGFLIIIFGSIIIYWAQSSTNSDKKNLNKERNTNFFFRGPYKYTRNPTNLGLTIMSLGLAFVMNSFFSIVFVLISYIIARLFFIKKQDQILKEKYGDVFEEYKKQVKDWL